MRVRIGINVRKWALPFSVNAKARPTQIGVLCFTFGITVGRSEPLRDVLILEDTSRVSVTPPLTTVDEEVYVAGCEDGYEDGDEDV